MKCLLNKLSIFKVSLRAVVILVPLSVFAIHTYPSYSEARAGKVLRSIGKWFSKPNTTFVPGQVGGRTGSVGQREWEKYKNNKKKKRD